MDAKGVRNMYSILLVFNKHNTVRVASCWFIIYYRLVMHGNSNIKKELHHVAAGRPLFMFLVTSVNKELCLIIHKMFIQFVKT